MRGTSGVGKHDLDREGEAAHRARLIQAGQMLAGVVHEINNPLAVIQGYAQLLQDRATRDEDRHDLQAILDETRRLAALVDDMLSYFDRASMACSLEVRVPFLDHEYVELCARVPTNVKVRRLQGKHVLREAARGLVPDFVLQKRKRGFFNEAVGTWLAAGNGEVVDRVLLGDSPAYEQVVDRAVVEQAVSSWRGGNVRQAPLLLSLVMLELWLGDYLPRAFALADGPVRSAA